MNILIVNDDGIRGEGLRILCEWAKTKGNVTVVAPAVEQSGKSHSIEIHLPYEVKEVDYMEGVKAYTVASTPADCVRIASIGLKLDIDLVFSGINRGYNIGADIIYSGTVGAASEASRLGYKSIAFSSDYASFEVAKAHLDEAYSYIMEKELLRDAEIINVNFPMQEPVKGFLITRQGPAIYSDEFEVVEPGMMRAVLQMPTRNSCDLTLDVDAVWNGYISISPLHIDRTDLAAYERILKRV